MRITVFGATGRTGHHFVTQALDAGHEVVAFARNPAKLHIKSDRLTVAKGSLTDVPSIEQAVRGSDAVIELVGAVSVGTQNIIAAMKKHGVRRIVVVSTASVKDPNDQPDWKFKLLVTFVKLTIRKAYKEVIKAADLVCASDLDWTLVRVPVLTNQDQSNHIRVGYYGHGIIRLKLSRIDMATFFLEQLHDTSYIQQSPAISN